MTKLFIMLDSNEDFASELSRANWFSDSNIRLLICSVGDLWYLLLRVWMHFN